jgi:hypothetical protein
MSVLKNKRGLSKLEFYHNARELRKNLTNLLLRDFGIKVKVRKDGKPMETETQKVPPGEVPADTDESPAISGEFPEWALSEFRVSIMRLLRGLIMNITDGNSIYPSKMDDPRLPIEYVRRIQSDELADRRRYQDAAIGYCQKLIQELQYVAEILPVRMEKILPFIDMVNFEIRLLKGWRKSTNELAKRIGINGGIGEEREES